jgi:hypothetical protein
MKINCFFNKSSNCFVRTSIAQNQVFTWISMLTVSMLNPKTKEFEIYFSSEAIRDIQVVGFSAFWKKINRNALKDKKIFERMYGI